MTSGSSGGSAARSGSSRSAARAAASALSAAPASPDRNSASPCGRQPRVPGRSRTDALASLRHRASRRSLDRTVAMRRAVSFQPGSMPRRSRAAARRRPAGRVRRASGAAPRPAHRGRPAGRAGRGRRRSGPSRACRGRRPPTSRRRGCRARGLGHHHPERLGAGREDEQVGVGVGVVQPLAGERSCRSTRPSRPCRAISRRRSVTWSESRPRARRIRSARAGARPWRAPPRGRRAPCEGSPTPRTAGGSRRRCRSRAAPGRCPAQRRGRGTGRGRDGR